MKRYEVNGFTGTITNDKVKIEILIKNLVCAFECSPNNYDESKIRRGKRQVFAEYLVKKLFDEVDQDTGSSYIEEAFDKVFDEMVENSLDFIKFTDEDEEE